MGGLLYKDFVSVNRIGKFKMTWIIAIYTILFIVLRIIFSGTQDSPDFIVLNENGENVNILDVFFLMFYFCVIIVSMSMISVSKIMQYDEKNKIRGYINTLPVGKNTYVASKYIFIGISAYVMMSLDYICGISCAAFCMEGRIQDIADIFTSLICPIMCTVIFLASITFPLYISKGKEIAMRVMVVFWTIIALVVIGYLMFGDLSIVEKLDINIFVDFINNHMSGFIIFQSMVPVIVLILYYLSYRLSCYLYSKNREES